MPKVRINPPTTNGTNGAVIPQFKDAQQKLDGVALARLRVVAAHKQRSRQGVGSELLNRAMEQECREHGISMPPGCEFAPITKEIKS